MKALTLLFLVGCAIEQPAVGETSAAMTVLDECAVGHAPNATDDVTVGTSDSYTRLGSHVDIDCTCATWQEIADADGEDAANLQVPTCRPYALVEFTFAKRAGDDRGIQLSTSTDFSDYVVGEQNCAASQGHMELWRETSPGTYTRSWQQTQPGHWVAKAARCYADFFPPEVTDAGVYRVRAQATLFGEHGYGDVDVMVE